MALHPSYAPDYRVRINDQDLPRALRGSVTSVRFQEGLDVADRVEIGIANTELRWLQKHVKGLGFQPFPTGVRIGPAHVSAGAEGLFDLDNKLTLALGYAPDPLVPVFEGEVTGLQVSFPSGGAPTMTLVAHDYLTRLARGKYSRGFGLVPDFLVAAILGAENMLLPAIDPAIAGIATAIAAINGVFSGTGIKQKGQSDLQLLQEIAASYDADFWVEGNVLVLSRFTKEYTPRLTLTYGSSLLDFSPQVSTVGQVAGVSVKFALREIPMDFVVSVVWDFDRETLNVTVVPGAAAAASKTAAGGALFTIVDQPVRSPADLLNSALFIVRELRSRLNERVTGSGSAVGDPRIRAGAVVRLEGLGPDFSGDYRVKSVTHSVDGGGYRTNFDVRREIIP